MLTRLVALLCCTQGVYMLTAVMACGVVGWWYIMAEMNYGEPLSEGSDDGVGAAAATAKGGRDVSLNPSLAHAVEARNVAEVAMKQPTVRSKRVVEIDLSSIECGWRCRATVWQGAAHRPALLTVHDAGLDHRECFESFLQFAAMLPQLGDCSVVHLDFSIAADGSSSATAPRTILAMAHAIKVAIEEIGIGRLVGFGAGVGATALLHLACDAPKTFRALILGGASSTEPSFAARALGRVALFCAEHLGMVGLLRRALGSRYFSARVLSLASRKRDSAESATVHRALAKLEPGTPALATAVAMLRAHLARRTLTLGELAALESVPLLLLARGSDLSASQQCNGCFLAPSRMEARRVQFATDPGRNSILSSRNAAHLAWCEDPADYTVPFSTFLRGL